MKKRFIALILAVVMCLLTFVGCGEYDYTDADLSKYTSVDEAAFKNALKSLLIEDGTFGTDNEERERQTLDMIYRSLANSDNLDKTEKKTGTPDDIDLLYYFYYAEAEVEGKKLVFDFDYQYMSADSDDSSSAKTATTAMLPTVSGSNSYRPYLQYGLNDYQNNELEEAVIAALKDKDIASHIFETNTDKTEKAKAGDFVLVTFTYKYTDAEGATETKTVTDLPLTVPASAEGYTVPAALADLREFGSFAAKLAGVALATKQTSLYKTPEQTPAEGEEVTATESVEYTDVTVSGVISGGEALDLEVTNFTVDDDTVKFKDVFGTEYDLTDVKLTYHVYPAYYIDVEYTAEAILTVFYGAEITTDALDIFASTDYKITYKDSEGNDAEKTLATLIEEFAKAQSTYDDAKAALEKAKDALESAETALKNAQQGKADAEKTLADANAKLAEAQAKVDTTKEAAKTAQETYDKAKAELEAAQNGTDEAALAAAQEAYNKAESELTAANSAYSDATTALTTAENYVDQSEKELNGVEEDEEDNGAVGKLADAETAYKDAYKALKGEEPAEIPNLIGSDESAEVAPATEGDAEGSADGSDDAEEEEKGAEETYNEALAARDNAVGLILVAKSATEGAEDIETAIMSDFKEFVYDTNVSEYFDEIYANLLVEVSETIDAYITVPDMSKLPRKAVKEVYEKIYEDYKLSFFASASSEDATSDYATDGGDFKKHLIRKTGTNSYGDAKDVLWADAQVYVAEIMKIYRAAEILGSDFVYTDEEFKAEHDKSEYNKKARDEYEISVAYYAMYGLSAYMPNMVTEQDLRTAEQFNKLYENLMAYEKDAEGNPVADENNIFKYTWIGYSVEAAD